MKDYLKLCVDYDNSVGNTKYTIEKMYKLNGDKIQKKKFSRDFENAETLEQIWYAYRVRSNFLDELQSKACLLCHLQSILGSPRLLSTDTGCL